MHRRYVKTCFCYFHLLCNIWIKTLHSKEINYSDPAKIKKGFYLWLILEKHVRFLRKDKIYIYCLQRDDVNMLGMQMCTFYFISDHYENCSHKLNMYFVSTSIRPLTYQLKLRHSLNAEKNHFNNDANLLTFASNYITHWNPLAKYVLWHFIGLFLNVDIFLFKNHFVYSECTSIRYKHTNTA